MPSGYFETPHEAGSLTSDWEKQTLELEYGTVLPKAHDYFYLRFEGDDLEGSSGGRDPIALDNVGVIAHTCELGEANCKCKATRYIRLFVFSKKQSQNQKFSWIFFFFVVKTQS